MKKTALIILTLAFSITTWAQNQVNQNASAMQTAKLALQNGISISYVSTNNGTGNSATMQFLTTNDYANGVPSIEQELQVRSNRSFSVAVRCDENTFTYTGNSTGITVNDLPNNALQLKVTENNTGGAIHSPFSASSYATLTSVNQDLLTNAVQGGNQRFKIKYMVMPGFALPAGVYSIDVVYTATQQ